MRKYRKNTKNFKFKIFCIFIVLLILICIIDSRLRPIIKNMSASQAKTISTFAINEAVSDELSKQNINYDTLVRLFFNSNGNVKSIETNIIKINILKATISTAIQKKLTELNHSEIKIPAGNLIGSDILASRGPKIPIKLTLAGNVLTDIESKFSSAGINQTRHRIMLNVKTNILVIIPGYNASTELNADFCIAETIIVGEVPDSFTNVIGDDQSLPGLINDYNNKD